MKQFLAFLFFICIVIHRNGQELPTVVPPPPNAASLGTYGQMPLGLFTGTSKVDISIYEFKSGKLTLPISLNYSSNRIKANEVASNVGIGWVLNAGGYMIKNTGEVKDNFWFTNFSKLI